MYRQPDEHTRWHFEVITEKGKVGEALPIDTATYLGLRRTASMHPKLLR